MTSSEDLRKPILPGKGASDYERYLRTDELLSLQKLPEEFLHKDELTFQVVHQASELLLKGVAWELERARNHIGEGDFSNATRLMRRATQMLDHPIYLLHVLETITPYDYHLIRASMVILFLFFGYTKWFAYAAEIMVPFISHGPFISWLYPVFGFRGATRFLGISEWLTCALLFAGFWNKKLGALGALGSVLTFGASNSPSLSSSGTGFPSATSSTVAPSKTGVAMLTLVVPFWVMCSY